VLPSV